MVNVSALQMYVDACDHLFGNRSEITVSVWEQHQYDVPQTSQGRKQQPSVATRSIWGALHNNCKFRPSREINYFSQNIFFLIKGRALQLSHKKKIFKYTSIRSLHSPGGTHTPG